MKIGLQIPRFDWPGSPQNLGVTFAEIARTADELGFASIWVMDHYFQIEGGGMGKADDPMLEGYSALSFLAGVTRHARLGTMVTGVNYRAPGYLVKQVSTLDVLSGGRAWLGIGAGWYEREAAGLGLPFPPLKERFERLEETIQIAMRMWAGDFSPYQGKHYHLAEPINSPQPLTKPHPPILIGSSGEKKGLRLVAQYADACNLFAFGDHASLVHKLDVLKRHCDDLGRNYDHIERTVLAPFTAGMGGATIADTIANCQALANLGIQHVIFTSVPDVHRLTPLEQIGREVIPAVAAL
ncbi:MAG: LLM class F420-dependent oxidoreductase [Anaerolineae bacterium]|nr:LLM class F420-dependent oxidoreductase [Anaerolineae bacterium]